MHAEELASLMTLNFQEFKDVSFLAAWSISHIGPKRPTGRAALRADQETVSTDTTIGRAAVAIASADALLIGAGAGMCVDSCLPDFRGTEGFWKAYPPYARLGLDFVELANPQWFRKDPALAWGFYGHRLNLYRATAPHEGFCLLQRWARRMRHGAFVYTSNVDGAFQAAGFDPERIVEVHGSIHWMQCSRCCGVELFQSEFVVRDGVRIDEATLRAAEPFPACPGCGALARPNILMFGDGEWDQSRACWQEARLGQWLKSVAAARVVVVECGAGKAIPTVRLFCESMADRYDATLVRLNIRDPVVSEGQISLAVGALAGLRAIDARLTSEKGEGYHLEGS
jgi:NAD-dependent SIR2 family protein deacetylase